MRRTPRRCLWLLLLLLLCAPLPAGAREQNRLRRIQVVPRHDATRIDLFFQDPPDYTLSHHPGRLRLAVRDADSPLFRKLRGYSDPRVRGIFCSRGRLGVSVTIAVQQGAGVQALSCGNPSVLSLIVGPREQRPPLPDIAPGREPILAGAERFVRDYAPPARAGLPFHPTRPELLKRLLPDAEAKLFEEVEGLLYKEQGKEALEILSRFLNKSPAVQALAWFRSGEALSLLQRDAEALQAFRKGEAIWPAYLDQAPQLLQLYAELKGRSGDFDGGRRLMVRVIGGVAGTVYAPPLVNRLANLYERHGDSAAALELSRVVAAHAPGSGAAGRGALKMADREMFSVPRHRYLELVGRYRGIYEGPGDQALRDEAHFKTALLHALYGPAQRALAASVSYDTRYPQGIFSTIVKKMREELLLPVYGELYAAKEWGALAVLALNNREYLERCFSDPEFPGRLAQAFHEAGLLTRELELFGYLAGRSWAASGAPLLTARIVEDSLALGDSRLAETTARLFLSRFPADPRVQRVREQLGRIAFEKGDLGAVRAELSFLGGKGVKPELAESDYYLGKALAAAGDQTGAERMLTRFTSVASGGSPLAVDGFFAVAGARVALNRYPAALDAYREGERVARGEAADQFLYKMGELYLRLNMVPQAREAWEKVAARGGRGTWVKLASESLNDLNWRLKIAGELP